MAVYLIFGSLTCIIILLCVIHVLFNHNKTAQMLKKLPGPRDDFIIGNGFTFICSAVELWKLIRKFANSWDGIYRVWIFPIKAVVIYNPKDIEAIMSNMQYADKSLIYTLVKPWLGDGLLVSNGTKWQMRRKLLTPAFHFNILRQFYEVLTENCDRLVEKLRETAGQPIDIAPVISEFTLNAICETAMGTRLSGENDSAGKTYKETVYRLGYLFNERLVRVYLYPDFIFNLSSLGREQNKLLKIAHAFTRNIIRERKEYIGNNGIDNRCLEEMSNDDYVYKRKRKLAMLDLLILAEKEGLIDEVGIEEEVDTFMFEGHDTTASGLTFFFMVLANHKDIQSKIVAELQEILKDPKQPITMEDLPKMRYLDRCIKESLRLYPPVHFISRSLHEPTILSNHKIPAETLCHISIYDLHHRADLYPNPEQFDPDRFLPENCVGRHPYSYIPFSAGQRNCIGQRFAMMEMKVTVAKVLQQFELLPVTRPEDIELKSDIVLRNNGPIIIKFAKRFL